MAAALFAIGQVLVPTAGQPVNVPVPPAVAGPLGAQGLTTAHAILVQALPSNSGKIYIGVAGLSKVAPFTGCLCVLPVPTANFLPTFSISLTAGANALSLSDLWVDADNSGEGVLVSGVIA